MLDSRLIVTIFIIITLTNTVDGAYRYVGCYVRIFHDSYFSSSYMEPNLCFRLCETPVIYIQKEMCRCSSGGLMDYDRQRNRVCSVRCPKPGNRLLKGSDTCGGTEAYSAYVEEEFYNQHAYLLDYRITYQSCELWNNTSIQNTLRVPIYQPSGKLPLSKLERCAAACLDKNRTTISIAFNDDSNQCSCILSKSSTVSSINGFKTLANNSCDRYCNNVLDDSSKRQKIKCGSMNDSNIWTVYKLDDICPPDFVYIKELQECMLSYVGPSYSCPSSSVTYSYDGNITWSNFLKIIDRLNLTNSSVKIEFDDDIEIDPSWRCATTTTTSTSRYSSYYSRTYYYSSINSYDILENGCLRSVSYSWSASRLLSRLCITYPASKTSVLDDIDGYFGYSSPMSRMIYDCPAGWLDLNKNCYRMSEKSKTIQEAKNNCIIIPENEINRKHEEIIAHISSNDDDKDDNENKTAERNNKIKDYITELHRGEVVSYGSDWQSRLGFYLLHTNIVSNESTSQNRETSLSTNQFQMMNTNSSCLVFTRSAKDDNRNSILKEIPTDKCSTPRPVLCATKPIMTRHSEKGCFEKPLALGLPTVISDHITYELCLTVCKSIRTNLAVIQMNKCFCLNAAISWIAETTRNNSKHRVLDCGNPCLGNKHDKCGNENTIVVYYILGSMFSYRFSSQNKQDKPNPDFVYNSCVYLNSVEPSNTYQYNFKRPSLNHPRHCLELCSKAQQKYALLNLNKCLCTNVPPPKKKPSVSLLDLPDFNCTQECPGNYFYTCGNTTNSSLYSMYVMEVQCHPGFFLDRDKHRCIYQDTTVEKRSLEDARSYCKSIHGALATVNDILEIQDLLSSSFFSFSSSSGYSFSSLISSPSERKRYFWIERPSNATNNGTTIDRTIERCTQRFTATDSNCVLLRYEKSFVDGSAIYERCLTESDQCSSEGAKPVCVDKIIDPTAGVTPLSKDESENNLKVNTPSDYICDNDTEYQLMDDYCYKVDFHETTWDQAKAKCESENATLFVPEKRVTVQLIKQLLLRHPVYPWTRIVHLGLAYDKQRGGVIQYDTKNGNLLKNVSDSDSLYYTCERSFLRRYITLTTSSRLAMIGKNDIGGKQIGCGYVDYEDSDPSISCNEIPCEKIGTVICQKPPIPTTAPVIVKRSYKDEPDNDDKSSGEYSDDPPPKSIARDFAPMFLIVAIICVLILLVLINIVYNRFLKQQKSNNKNHPDSVYSPLSIANEFDLN